MILWINNPPQLDKSPKICYYRRSFCESILPTKGVSLIINKENKSPCKHTLCLVSHPSGRDTRNSHPETDRTRYTHTFQRHRFTATRPYIWRKSDDLARTRINSAKTPHRRVWALRAEPAETSADPVVGYRQNRPLGRSAPRPQQGQTNRVEREGGKLILR